VKSSKVNIVPLKTAEPPKPSLDWLKWLVAAILVLAGLIGNHYYSEVSMPLRTLGWLALLALAALVASRTEKGKWAVEFFGESRAELRKVVWPTREETMQTTMVVGVMVVVLALVLWGMDGILVSLIGWLTGQRG
jgi:preprotein translocase subunit SecE